MIIANHAHVSPADVKPSGTVDKLKELMDSCEIDKAVCFAPFKDKFVSCGREDDPNDWLANEIKGSSDLYGFGTVDFEADDIRGQVDKIAELGFKGIKLHPPYQEFVIDGDAAFKVYERAQELDLFISFHSGMHWHRLRDNRVLLFDEVAWNFPNLRLSMEHIGGYHFFKEALAVMCNNSRGERDTVYAGWTSIDNRKGATAWSLTDEQLETVILQTGENRSIFGIDFPFRDVDTIRWDIDRIKRLNLTDECKAKILGGTLAKILDI